MSRPLDFIVFGIARSGTKGLVKALNLHPQVYCAEERFHFRTDHSNLRFPDSFLDARDLHNKANRVKIERIRKELAAKEEVTCAGNKLPRYFFALNRINREVPRLKNIWIYRSPYGFVPSWNRREEHSKQEGWPAGQVGLFGILELLQCILACLNLPKDTFVFSYRHGLGASPDAILDTLDFLGADPARYDRDGAVGRQRTKLQRRSRTQAADQSILQAHEAEFLDRLRIRDLDAIMEGRRSLHVSEIAAELREYLDGIAPILPDAIDHAFLACDNPALSSFGREHFHRNRAELAGLLRLAEGSNVLESFQRFGLYERLKALYAQRSALKRRLLAQFSASPGDITRRDGIGTAERGD